jgi:hypothetical protein
MDWTRSLGIDWRYSLVDPETWSDTEEIASVRSCSLSWDAESELLVSGSIEVDEAFRDEAYVRVWCDARQGDLAERHAVATLLCQTSKDGTEGTVLTVSADAYSPLIELRDDKPPIGWSVSGSADDAIALICSHMRAPFVPYESGVELAADVVAADDESWLDMLWAVCDEAGLEFWLDGMGRLVFGLKPEPWALQPIQSISDTDERGILYAERSRETDLFEIPNHFEAVRSDPGSWVKGEAWNRDPASRTSTVRRGRPITSREMNPDGLPSGSSQEVADEYARKRLREESVITRTYSIGIGYIPLRLGDAIRFSDSKLGAEENVMVIGMELNCDVEARLDLTATSTEELWSA